MYTSDPLCNEREERWSYTAAWLNLKTQPMVKEARRKSPRPQALVYVNLESERPKLDMERQGSHMDLDRVEKRRKSCKDSPPDFRTACKDCSRTLCTVVFRTEVSKAAALGHRLEIDIRDSLE
jgi:hypothetical protein